ncbi:MAG: DUF5654 family protein [Candidatus Micrarchaeota archaeon]|nr:DUF5654 family protein [Candidatus Micrarchaeota archaeon]
MEQKKPGKTTERLAALKEFEREFRKQLITFIAASFAFVAALFWNTAITDTIKLFIPLSGAWFYELISAAVVTALAVTVIYFLSRYKPQ